VSALHPADYREPETFGEWLRRRRATSGLTMGEVARALELTTASVSSYETGAVGVAPVDLPVWAHVYRVPLEEATAAYERLNPPPPPTDTCPSCGQRLIPEPRRPAPSRFWRWFPFVFWGLYLALVVAALVSACPVLR
jgi:transcriptional regulator with XRE-family HTH domain